MSSLVIVESPNKISKLKKILGSDYVVMASVGHFTELSKKQMGIDTTTWEGDYQISDSKKDVVKKIQEEAKNHDNIYIASDPDQEGEKIAFDLKDIMPKKGKNIYRIKFNEITKAAVLNAVKNPSIFDEKILASQQTRRFMDRICGFKISPILWSKGLKNTSAGRVQSVVLRWLVEREREISSFVKEEYWTITVKTKKSFDAEFFGINSKKLVPKNEAETKTIIKEIKGDLVVSDYQAKMRTRSPQPPYITATLMQDASTKFGWNSKKVMDVSQQLFVAGNITYHRTDSVKIDLNKISEVRDEIEKKFGKKFISPTVRVYQNSDNSQEAHEAIRPTGEPLAIGIDSDMTKLYELISNRFMASQMADAEFDQTNISLDYVGKDAYNFRTSGSIIKFEGFLKVIGNSSKDITLPILKVGDKIGIKEIVPEQHFTKAPARHSEASIVNKMKADGIGRPSTYASIIETLLGHGYVVRDKKNLKATDIGGMTYDYLAAFFQDIVNSEFTAKMETALDNIKDGQSDLKTIMDVFYNKLTIELDAAKKASALPVFKTDISCPTCNNDHKMVKKISTKVFLSCESYPTCGHTMNFDEDGKIIDSQAETGLACPDCGNKIVEKAGKWGKFLSCSSYPACTWKGKLTADGQIAERKISEVTDIDCNACGKKMVKRAGNNSTFFLGCGGYPKCKNTMNIDEAGNPVEKVFKGKPKAASKATGNKCPSCKFGDLVVRTNKSNQNTFIACGNFPKCRYISKGD